MAEEHRIPAGLIRMSNRTCARVFLDSRYVLAEIIEQAEEAARLAATVSDPRLLALTRVVSGQVLEWHGEFERALGHLGSGVELARETHSGFVFRTGSF